MSTCSITVYARIPPRQPRNDKHRHGPPSNLTGSIYVGREGPRVHQLALGNFELARARLVSPSQPIHCIRAVCVLNADVPLVLLRGTPARRAFSLTQPTRLVAVYVGCEGLGVEPSTGTLHPP